MAKTKNPALYTSERQDWQTPPELIQKILCFEQIFRFDLDVCCTHENVPAARYFKENETNALTSDWVDHEQLTPWGTRAFMNPPYGRIIKQFMEKAVQEVRESNVRLWAVLPARVDTHWFHDNVFSQECMVVFLRSRIAFWLDNKPYLLPKKDKNGVEIPGKFEEGVAPFPTCLVYYGRDYKKKAERWNDLKPIEGSLMLPGGK